MADLSLINIPGTGPIIRGEEGFGTRATADFLNFQKDATETFSVNYTGLPDPAAGQATRQIQIQISDLVANSNALSNFLFEARAGITVTNAQICVDTATATGAVNGQVIVIKNSSGDATVCTYTTAVADPGLAQATWTTMGAITNGAMVAGDKLYTTYAKVADGLAMSGVSFLIDYTMST